MATECGIEFGPQSVLWRQLQRLLSFSPALAHCLSLAELENSFINIDAAELAPMLTFIRR